MNTIVDLPAQREKTCSVIYRASVPGQSRAIEVRLHIDAAAASVADAWAHLTAVHPGVDPYSLEIEIREGATA